jgi:hypothetical protein
MTNETVTALVGGLFELCRVSQKAKRPEFTEDMGEQLMDWNPPLPCLLAAFSQGDAVVGCFDDESQTAMEVTPRPNLTIPLKISEASSIAQVFRTLAIVCETLAAASRLIDLMPGNPGQSCPGPARAAISPRNNFLARGVRESLVCRRGPSITCRSEVLAAPPKEALVPFSTGGEMGRFSLIS